MTEIKSYKCDKCGMIYETSEAALKCEKSHATPIEIVDCEYIEGYELPKSIRVKMDNGAIFQY